ncbi:MAG: LysR family transcriptional regulator [Vibrio sp.]
MLTSPHITLKMLRYFNEVAKQQSFSAAAEELNITKSPLSAQIRALEAQLDVTLLHRDTRNVSLTDAGRQLQEECRLIFDVLDTSINRVKQRHRYTQNTINIGLMSSVFWVGFGDALYQMQQCLPEITYQLIEMSPEQQKRALHEGRIDIGFVRYADTHNIAPLQASVVLKERMVAAVGETHRLAQRKQLRLKQLSQEAFVALSHSNSAATSWITKRCQHVGFYPNIVQEVTEPSTLLAVISTRGLLSIVPQSYANMNWPHIYFIPLQESLSADICALTIPSSSVLVEQSLAQLKKLLSHSNPC